MINLPKVIEKKFVVTKGVDKILDSSMSLFRTDMNRATHYNTIEDIQLSRAKVHNALFSLDRSLYGCIACLPGTTDTTKMFSVSRLLAAQWNEDDKPILTVDHERKIIDHLVSALPPNRMLNLFNSFSTTKINNARMRKTVLPFILNSNSLEWWSVKYRKKLKNVLIHCWGKRMSSVIEKILWKTNKTEKEFSILNQNITKYLVTSNTALVQECIAFVFEALEPTRYVAPLFKKYYNARHDFKEAEGLPKEVIEGIRTTFHPKVDKAETLKVAEKSMTVKEKRLVQNQAKKSDVKVEWDPIKQPLVELFVYGFKMGFDSKVKGAINSKATVAAKALPFNYKYIGILCDDSFSMSGSSDQKLKALAINYATCKMLQQFGSKTITSCVSDRTFNITNKPAGGTNLAKPFVSLLKHNPDAIFIVSDGYENAPEGRFNEVLKIAKDKLKIDIPIYHFNPVIAAESKTAAKKLSDDIVVTPVTNPEKMELGLIKTLISTDPKSGILELFNLVLPKLEKTKQLYARKAIGR